MAHDHNLRRSDDPYMARQPAAGQGSGSDPLAELARLIGQDDPFSDLGRKRAQGASAGPADAGQGAPDWPAREQGRGRAADEGQASEQPAAGHEAHDPYDPRYDDPRYASEAYQGAYAADGSQNPDYGYDPNAYYDDGQPPEGDGYEQPVPEKRRGGMMTILAVVALAVFGTGAVFAYRAWTGPAKTGEPPVIKAEQGPAKIVPAQSGDALASKQVYDRPSDKGGERIVAREEQPADVRTATGRPVTPGVVGGASGSVLPPLPGQSPQANAGASGEPKKVKTMAIRPDQPVATPSPPAPTTSLPPSRVAPPQGAVPVQTTPVTPSRTAQAAVPSPQVAARAPETAESGGYLVQVTSQRTEADAQASYRTLQSQHPTVLGNRRPIIKRTDLGEKGIFFRAHVGPFQTAEEAGAMCSSLKEAGVRCLVQRN
jgi:hypothetical protein